MSYLPYSHNIPVMYSDVEGTFAISATVLLIGGLLAGGIGFGIAVYNDYKDDKIFFNGDWTNYVGRTLGGFVTGFGIGVATVLGAGVGGILGGVLIGAGAGSIINRYANEANGGSFTAGYWGGAISGALCGVGAGLGGLAFAAASEATNLACAGYLVAGCIGSFAGGFLGNFAGSLYTEWHDSGLKKITVNSDTIMNSIIMGSLNIFAGLGAAASTITSGMGRIAADVNSKVALRIVSGLIAGGTEATYDSISYLISVILNNL